MTTSQAGSEQSSTDTKNHLTARQQIDQLDKWLDEASNHYGLPATRASDRLDEYTCMTSNEIAKLPPSRSSEIYLEFAMHINHIQKIASRNAARLHAIQAEMNRAVGKVYDKYKDVWGAQDKRAVMVAHDEYIGKLHEFETKFKCLDIELSGRISSLKEIMYAFKNVGYARRNEV